MQWNQLVLMYFRKFLESPSYKGPLTRGLLILYHNWLKSSCLFKWRREGNCIWLCLAACEILVPWDWTWGPGSENTKSWPLGIPCNTFKIIRKKGWAIHAHGIKGFAASAVLLSRVNYWYWFLFEKNIWFINLAASGLNGITPHLSGGTDSLVVVRAQ